MRVLSDGRATLSTLFFNFFLIFFEANFAACLAGLFGLVALECFFPRFGECGILEHGSGGWVGFR